MEGKLSYWVRSIRNGECEFSLLQFWRETCRAHIHPADWYALKETLERDYPPVGLRSEFIRQRFCGVFVWQDVNMQRGMVRMELDLWRYERRCIALQFGRSAISIEEMFNQLKAVDAKYGRLKD